MRIHGSLLHRQSDEGNNRTKMTKKKKMLFMAVRSILLIILYKVAYDIQTGKTTTLIKETRTCYIALA